MKWKAKDLSIYDTVKRKFAFFPTKIDDKWIWLESYYELTCWNIFGCYPVVYRWKTKEEAEYDISEAINAHPN